MALKVYLCYFIVVCILPSDKSIFDLQIEDNRLYFRELAQSKCGSLDYINHIPRGGDKKVQTTLMIVRNYSLCFAVKCGSKEAVTAYKYCKNLLRPCVASRRDR